MITAIITDFDGTLVDTFQANLLAYQQAFNDAGLRLTTQDYKKCFGLRFDALMAQMGIVDDAVAKAIRDAKAKYYPKFFSYLRPNAALIHLIDSFHKMGGKTAIASTARKENLMNAVNYLNIASSFDKILTSLDVEHGKPDPEIYVKAMSQLNAKPSETLIFEDSSVGVLAAKASRAEYIKNTI